jgi:hypothetical protein
MIYEIDMCFHDINLLVEGKVSYLMQDEDTIMKQHARQLEKMKSEGLLKYLKYQYSVDGSVFDNNLLDLYKVLLFFYKKRQVKLINNNIMTKVQYSRIIKFLESDIKKLEKVKDLFIKNKYSRTLAIGKIHIIK